MFFAVELQTSGVYVSLASAGPLHAVLAASYVHRKIALRDENVVF